MRIIIISEQALRKAVPSAKQRAAVRKTSFAVVSASKIKAFTDKFFSGMGAFAEAKANEFHAGTEPDSIVDKSPARLKIIYPGIIGWSIPHQSKYADAITLKNYPDVEWLDYLVLLNPTQEIKISDYDAIDIGNLAHLAQYAPPPFNHKAQEILNQLKNEFHARTENNSEVN